MNEDPERDAVVNALWARVAAMERLLVALAADWPDERVAAWCDAVTMANEALPGEPTNGEADHQHALDRLADRVRKAAAAARRP